MVFKIRVWQQKRILCFQLYGFQNKGLIEVHAIVFVFLWNVILMKGWKFYGQIRKPAHSFLSIQHLSERLLYSVKSILLKHGKRNKLPKWTNFMLLPKDDKECLTCLILTVPFHRKNSPQTVLTMDPKPVKNYSDQ